MKHIAQVVQHLRPGGIETMALDLADFCESHEKTYIISLEGELEQALTVWPRLEPYKEQLIFLNKQAGIRLKLVHQLKNLFKRLNISSVHSHHIGPLLYAGFAARLAKVSHLTHTEHDAWHLDNTKRCLLQRLTVKLLKPTLVADAESVASNLKTKLKQQRVHVIRNGIDTQRFIQGDKQLARQQLQLPKHALLVGCSGRLEEVKGQRILIDALSILPEEVHLVLAGTGSTQNDLIRQTTQLKLTERVHFLGRVDDMPCFYQALDAFCLPSFNEGFPLSPLEAQACNIPAVITNVGGAHETLCPDSGSLAEAGNPNMLAAQLSNILTRQHTVSPRPFVKQTADVRQMAKAYALLRQ